MKLPVIHTALLAGLLLLSPAEAITTTQTVNLSSGWNSVWLNVDPIYPSGPNAGAPVRVEDLFANPAVEIVATPIKPFGSVEFIADPSGGFFNQGGWRSWHRTTALGANTLARIHGYRAYLIKASSPVTVNVVGSARYVPHTWQPDRYNLTGFGLHTAATFGDFFADVSTRHPVNKIFRLNSANGSWEAVRPSDPMSSCEAYWIYCDGMSDWTGSAKVAFQGYGELDFGQGIGTVAIPGPSGDLMVNLRELTFTNITSTSRSVTLTKALPATTGGDALADELRLYKIGLAPGTLTYNNEGQVVSMPFPVDASSSRTVVLGGLSGWTTGNRERQNLYRVEFDHHYYWLPATASNENLSDAAAGPDAPGFAGLWIGEVIFDQVSSITENGRPLQPTTTRAPMRLLLHADSNGATRLLSHVLIMQTKTADPSVVPELVLFTDEAQIPFYEGIEERGGKRVGRRVECTGYDMPRDFDIASQSTEFLTVVAQDNGLVDGMGDPDPTQVTNAHVEDHIRTAATRPPTLGETYLRAWDLSGGLGPNTVVTTTNPLVLDPFHRSNPFRHAFHPQHGTGRDISRAMTLTFDSTNEPGLLIGSYHETITGLAAFPIEAQGTLKLQRAVESATLAE